MKKNLLLLLVLVSVISISCKRKKDVDCDATLCVVNHSADTIRYCWGCNSYNEKIVPGGSACTPVGHIKIKHHLFSTDESTTDVFFQTSEATYQIPVDECNEERIIE
ncbi:MAG: hypothetical protein ABIP51_18500 [Bacteroidia bacterium]